MKRIVSRAIPAVLAVAVLAPGAGSAHTGWSVGGSVKSPAPSCGQAPSCQAFFLSGCVEEIAQRDGVEISIVKLPEGTAGHRARFTYTATAGPLFTVTVEPLGNAGGRPCQSLGASTIVVSGQTLSVPSNAVYVAVSGQPAVDLQWTLTGVVH